MILIHVAEGSGPMGGKVIAINPAHILAIYPQSNGCNRIVFDKGVPMVADGGELSVTDPMKYLLDLED